MTVKSGFFDSINSDRLYNAADINMMFEGVISDGVFELVGNGLRVEKDPGLMSVLVRDGRAWFNGTWLRNTSTLSLSLIPSSFINDRIDLIILEFDSGITVRQNSIKVLTGIPAAIPIPPILANTPTLKQYTLAEIRIPAGASSILDGNITNKIGTINTPYASLRELEPLDPDLEDIAYLTPSDNDILQRKSGKWVSRTVAQYITDLTAGLSALFAPINLILVRDWFLTWSVHFDTDPSWSWVNNPTGANGIKTFSDSHFHLQPDDTLAKCFYYQTGSVTNKAIYLMGQVETNAEGGVRVDDGTDNNYWELYLATESAGKISVKMRVRTGGGAATTTTLITGLPSQKWGIFEVHEGTTVYLYIFRDHASAISYVGQFSSISPTGSWRYGIFGLKLDAGNGRGAWWDAWSFV